MAETLRRIVRSDWPSLAVFGIFGVAGVVWLANPWSPVEDLAITELMVREMRADPALAGAYSSLPFRHPGPALFWWLWGPYELFGGRSSALLAANIWFNGAVLALIVALARRLGGRVLAPLIVGAVLIWSRAGGLPRLLEPWNPWVGVLPMVALVLLAWAMAERRAWAIPFAAALATWVVQAHIQFAPTALVLCVAGLGTLVVRTVRDGGRASLHALIRPCLVAVGVAAVMWAPVAFDLLANGSESNPRAIASHYGSSEEPPIDGSDVVNVIRSQLSLEPTWAGGPQPYHYFLVPAAVLAPLAVPGWVIAAALAIRRRAWTEVRGLAMASIGLAASAFALTRITGSTFGPWYLVAIEAMSISVSVIALTSLVSSIGWVVGLVRDRRASSAEADHRQRAPIAEAAAVGVTLALVIATAGSLQHLPEDVRSAEIAEGLLPDVREAIEPGRAVLLRGTYEFGGWIHGALVLQLDRAGYEVHVRTPIDDKYPASLEEPPPGDALLLTVVTDPSSTDWAPGVEVIADAEFVLGPGDPLRHVYVVSVPEGAPMTNPT